MFLIFQLLFSVDATEDCEWSRKNYKYSNDSFSLRAIEYLTKANPDKVIIYLPPTGGTNPLDRTTAKFFCTSGVSTVILDRWTGFTNEYSVEDLGAHQIELDNAKKALLALTNHIYKDRKIGVFGVSKGAIGVTAFKNEFKSNLKSLFLVAAGSPIHLTISRAGARVLRALREERLRAYKIDQLTYDAWINELLDYQTVNKGNSIKLGMVMAKRDTVVPTVLQQNLVNRWRPDKLWTTDVDHFRTILTTHLNLREDVFEFFRESL